MLKDNNVRPVGVSYDSVEVLKQFSEQHGLSFTLLSDPDSVTIKAFGLLNKDAEGKAQGISYPGIIILDKEGTIRAKLFFEGYRERHSATDIAKAVSEIDSALADGPPGD